VKLFYFDIILEYDKFCPDFAISFMIFLNRKATQQQELHKLKNAENRAIKKKELFVFVL
jgi:hypothetical protein